VTYTEEDFFKCCGCRRWAKAMAARSPFKDEAALYAAADEEWAKASKDDVLEAFRAHPKIGAKAAHGWAKGEQSGMDAAEAAVREELARGNEEYEKKFGYIYIVCATGKSAPEMLEILRARLPHTPEEELKTAAGEQAKITKIRLAKLRSGG
jgi:OHCU decarboxylase